MKLATLEDLFLHELKDMLSAEKQILKALPKMAKGATSEKLSAAFEEHRSQTEGHVARLEKIFEMVEKTPRAEHCDGMEGLLKEGSDLLEEEGDETVIDAALISAAQKVEHYEIAGYGSLRSLAEILGMKQAVKLLQQTLDEEKKTDVLLTELAMSEINVQVPEDEEEEAKATRR